MGQPILVGHHSEKRHRRTLDRSWDALGRAVEQTRKAEMHESKAANLEAALDRTIFSDDDNAVEAIEARIAEREAARERMKTVNKLYKKADVEGLKALGLDYEKLKAQLAALGSYFGQAPHMPYELSNMGGRIQADKKRLEAIKMQSARKERAEAATNGRRSTEMTIYRNTRFTERNYECTNVVACELVDAGARIPEGYEVANDAFRAYARNLTPLWIEAGVRYYGYL
jgi:hypothetical protein